MTRLFEAKPFIIAEVGSNWQNLEHCLESIRVAKECGADAVKFQAFSQSALYGFDNYVVNQGVIDAQLPLGWLPTLKEKADEVGIEFMCTAFSPELVYIVDPYVLVHKVASSDAAWPQMLDAVAGTGKPVLLSLGAKSYEDRRRASPWGERDNWVAMYCVAAYPADYVSIEEIGLWDGLSDHTLGYSVAVEAALTGITVIEKHFTAFPDLDTPDRTHSLTPAQFKNMATLIRNPTDAISQERDMYLRHNRRLIATRNIASGEMLKYGENFGAYRSLEDDTLGLSPFDWEKPEGALALNAIERGKPIKMGDF